MEVSSLWNLVILLHTDSFVQSFCSDSCHGISIGHLNPVKALYLRYQIENNGQNSNRCFLHILKPNCEDLLCSRHTRTEPLSSINSSSGGDPKSINNSAMSVFPATATRSRARRVFGDIVEEEDVSSNSLSYSPSPTLNRKGQSELAEVLKVVTDLSHNDQSQKENQPREKENKTREQGKPAAANKVSALNKSKGRKLQKGPSSRRDLLRKTEDAVKKANISVNQSLKAARNAKVKQHLELANETEKFRIEWKEDKEEAQAFFKKAEESRRELLALQRQLSSKFLKAKSIETRLQKQAKLGELEKESQFNSSVHREQQKALKAARDRKRRESAAARAKLRLNHRQGTERMRLMQIREDQAIFDERHEFSKAQEHVKKTSAELRRKSFQFRIGDARRIRELHAKLYADQLKTDHADFELKWAAERDATNYENSELEKKRQSLQFRRREAFNQRELGNSQKEAQLQKDHEDFESKWAGERDANEYQETLRELRRKSLAFRNADSSRQRAEMQLKEIESRETTTQSYQMKWAGEKDAEGHKRQCEKEKRESLMRRNKFARDCRERAEEIRSTAQAKEHLSYELKWAGERDANAHKAHLREIRRRSLEMRNRRDAEWQERRNEQRSEAMLADKSSYALKWAGEKDAEEHAKQQADARRKSLRERNQEKAQHARVMDELRVITLERESESLMLKWAGEKDAQGYRLKMEEERRQSLRFRNREGRRQREVSEEARRQELMDSHRNEQIKSLGELFIIPLCCDIFIQLTHNLSQTKNTWTTTKRTAQLATGRHCYFVARRLTCNDLRKLCTNRKWLKCKRVATVWMLPHGKMYRTTSKIASNADAYHLHFEQKRRESRWNGSERRPNGRRPRKGGTSELGQRIGGTKSLPHARKGKSLHLMPCAMLGVRSLRIRLLV